MSQFFFFSPAFTDGNLNAYRPSMWVDADPVTMTLAGADVVQWADKSGNGRNFTQGTSGLRPDYEATGLSNGKPCVAFDGTSSVLPMDSGGLNMFNGASGMSVLVVGQMATVTTGSGVFFYASDGAGTGTARFTFFRNSGGANNLNSTRVRRLDSPAVNVALATASASPINTVAVMLAVYDAVGQTLTFYQGSNAAVVFTGSTATLGSGNVSATNSATIRLGTDGSGSFKALKERTVAAWNRALRPSEVAEILRYYAMIN